MNFPQSKNNNQKQERQNKLKAKFLSLLAALVALLHADSEDKDQIAKLKGQIADLTSQLTLTEDEQKQADEAATLLAAGTPPVAAEVVPVAAIAPDTTQTAAAIPATVAAVVPADVAAAAAVAPAPVT